uniref:TNFR-Cys domain-containing protein n=1 Tax=Magallana gigas TaxID=29159 RepID=A0A8W8JB87_MAGGI|nr:uncharacterized protein LOC105319439 isoform X2 [Crassostrea gigas]
MNSMITILILLCYLLQFIAFINSDICRSQDGNLDCCPGFVWNTEENRCTQCEAGTIGPRCEIVCPYPWYGKQCLSKCNCSKDHCDTANGCIGWTTQDSLAGHSPTPSRAEGFNDITGNANTSTHKKKSKDNKHDGSLKYFILSPLVVAFILCLLYVRLVFRCHFEHS